MNARSIYTIILLAISVCFWRSVEAQSLVAPMNKHTQIDSTVQLIWNGCVAAESYELQIANISDFSSNNSYSVIAMDTSLSLDTGLYFWRVRCISAGVPGAWSNVRNFSIFEFPNNLALWLASDSGLSISGNQVIQWNDISGNNHVFTESNSTQQPQFEDTTFNGIPTIHFDGTDDRLYCTTFAVSQPYTLYFVFQSSNIPFNYIFDGLPQNTCRLGSNGSGRYSFRAGSFFLSSQNSQPDFNIVSYQINGANSTIQEDFIDLYSSPGDVGSGDVTGGFIFGSTGNLGQTNPNNYAEFALCEFIIFDTLMDSLTIFRTEQYLQSKYAPSVNLGQDINVDYGFCDIVLSPLEGNFKDFLWSTGESTPAITVNQSGQYWVLATDTFGFTSSDTILVNNLVDLPNFSDTTICFGTNTLFDTEFSPSNYTFEWFGLVSADSFVNISLENTYAVSITDTNNCVFNSDTVFVNVDSLELSFTLGNDTSFCLGNTLAVPGGFTFDSYLWNTNDTTPYTTIQNQGDYWVNVVNANSCAASDTVFITSLGTAPTPDFESTFGCANTPITFYDSSSASGNTITLWAWDFGDNNSDNVQNPSHSYSLPGTYTVELFVETASGCFNSIQQNITIPENPVANFVYDIPCAQSQVSFQDQSSGGVVQWSWLNATNPTITSQNADLTFLSEGFEDVQLIVEDSSGCIDSVTQTIEVFPALLPDFEVADICIGDTVQFTETTPSFSVISRQWDFGFFNQVSSAQNPQFYYPSTGSYTVNLSVENAIGCTNSISKVVEIRELPSVNFASANTCEGTPSTFIDLSTTVNGTIVNQQWDIDGEQLLGDTVNYTFGDVQTYQVSLQIEDNFGCLNDSTTQVEVFGLPTVDFSFNPNYGEAPIDITFANQSSNDAVDFFWDFGDGSGSSIDLNPVYTYNTNGNYNILLIGSTAQGCADSLIREIAIIPTELDLELSNFTIQKVSLADGSTAYQPSVLLKNVGTRTIFNAELVLRVNNETTIAETWEGIIPVGVSQFYELENFALVKNPELLDYICLEAILVNDNTELNLSNNKVCLIQQGEIQCSPVYPNPAKDMAYIDVVMENDGTATLEIFELSGRLALKGESIQLVEGYNQVAIQTHSLQAGKYIVNLSYQEDITSFSLIITNP